jgi:hypothetical protein
MSIGFLTERENAGRNSCHEQNRQHAVRRRVKSQLHVLLGMIGASHKRARLHVSKS